MYNYNQLIQVLFVAFLGFVTLVAPAILLVWNRSKLINILNKDYRKFIYPIIAISFWSNSFERVGLLFAFTTLLVSILIAYLQISSFWERFSAVLFGIVITTTLPWWRLIEGKMDISTVELGLIFTILISIILILDYNIGRKFAIHIRCISPKWGFRALLIIFVLLSIPFISYQGLILGDARILTWHHWSAYIGPARLTLAGAIPLHDFPAQYGLGPTLVLAVTCKLSNCWDGMYLVTSILSIIFFAVLALMSLQITQREKSVIRLLALICIAVCSLGWTMFPKELLSPLATPSTSGMRFLPAVVTASYLIIILQRILKDGLTLRYILIGNIIWMLSVFWSPEAGIHTTIMWASFFVWANFFTGEVSFSISRFIWVCFKIFSMFIIIIALLIFIYFFFFGVFPNLFLYVSFLQNPPGVLPINSSGPIWIAITCFGIWIVAFYRSINKIVVPTEVIESWIFMLLALVTFTYFLGRSHDNNILNLLVYFVLLLFSVRRVIRVQGLRLLTNTLIAACLAWIPFFEWNGYTRAIAENSSYGVNLAEIMSYDNASSAIAIAEHHTRTRNQDRNTVLSRQQNLRDALTYIDTTWVESIEIIDTDMLINSSESNLPWSGVHPISTSYYMPAKQRKLMMERVANRIQRNGWLVIHKDFEPLSVLEAYDEIYKRDQEFNFGEYIAIRFIFDHNR